MCSIWVVLERMTAAELGFEDAAEWDRLRLRMAAHMREMPALLPLLEMFFKWTERFSSGEPTICFLSARLSR